MAKSYFLAGTDAGKAGQFNNMALRLPGFKATLGISDAEVASQQADAAFFNWALNCQSVVNTFAQQWTAHKNAARNGTGPTLGPEPVLPDFGPAPAPVAPGIVQRYLALRARIHASAGFTEAIGEALGTIGDEQAGPDLVNVKPTIAAEIVGSTVLIRWQKANLSRLEIHVDRGDGKGFVYLTVDSVPDYVDTFAFPPAGQAAVWKYMAIYQINDERVGQWSDTVTIAVAGK